MKRLLMFALPLGVGVALLLSTAALSLASPAITLPEVEAMFPDFVNHEEMNPNAFEAPCVDAAGKLTLNADVSDIMGTVTEPIVVAMVCQQIGLPAFSPLGSVTFSDAGMILLTLTSVPAHPDAFAIEFVVPLGVNTFSIEIENSGWPEGCLTALLDFAAWDLMSVHTRETSFAGVKAQY
jgi:hypothetical protein